METDLNVKRYIQWDKKAWKIKRYPWLTGKVATTVLLLFFFKFSGMRRKKYSNYTLFFISNTNFELSLGVA